MGVRGSDLCFGKLILRAVRGRFMRTGVVWKKKGTDMRKIWNQTKNVSSLGREII